MVGVFGYSENEADAAVGVLECDYRTAVQSHGVFDDGEAETCTSEFAAPALVDTIEPLEDTRQMLLRDSNAIVGEGELPMGVGMCTYRLALKDVAKVQGWQKPNSGIV